MGSAWQQESLCGFRKNIAVIRRGKIMTKTPNPKPKNTYTADSKPTQLAKLIYRGIVRYIKAKNTQNREEKHRKRLDFTGERRVNRRTNID